jgi:hypothetical protein
MLRPGYGELYVVTISATSDPTDQRMDDRSAEEIGDEIASLLERLRETTEKDAMKQVLSRETYLLCYPCYSDWIEHPFKSDTGAI